MPCLQAHAAKLQQADDLMCLFDRFTMGSYATKDQAGRHREDQGCIRAWWP